MSFGEDQIYSASEVAEMTKLSEEKLLEHAQAGFAPCLIIDGQYFFKKRIFSWVKKHFVKVQKGITFPEKLTIFIDQPAIETTMGLPKEIRKLEGLKKYDFWHFPPCVYFLVHGNELVYIGQALHLPKRLFEHQRMGKVFDQVYFLEVPKSELNKIERMFIREIETKYNKESFSATKQNKNLTSTCSGFAKKTANH